MRVILKDGSVTEVDEHYAAAIAVNLSGLYPGTTTEMVMEQLNKPEADRDIIGFFAYGMLEKIHVIPEL